MPVGWIEFSTASTRAAAGCRDDPLECERNLRADLRSCGATIVGRLLFAVDKRWAYATVRDLDRADPRCRKAVLDKWGAEYTKALLPEEASESYKHLDRLEETAGAEFVAPELRDPTDEQLMTPPEPETGAY